MSSNVASLSTDGALVHDAGATWRHVARSADVDGHARAQPQWSLQYDQLSCGSFAGFVHHVQLPGLRVIHEVSSQAVHQHGMLREAAYSFGLAVAQDRPAFFSGQALGRDDLMLGGGDELDLCSPTNFGLIAVVVDAPLLETVVAALHDRPLSPSWRRQLVTPADPARAARLRAFHLSVLDDIRAHPQLLADPIAALELRDQLLLDWLGVLPVDPDLADAEAAQARRRVVRRACALVLATPDEPLSIDAACSRIGASRRKLEDCFKGALGVSPARYLRAVRLNGVRRELRRPTNDEVTVADVASRWGFWHQGEFSATYKQQFGELPSVTLRDARERRNTVR